MSPPTSLAAGARARARLIGIALCLAVLTPASCVVERVFDEPDTVEAERPPVVPPFGYPVAVVATYPLDGALEVGLDTPIWFALNQYVDPDAFSLSRTIRLTSNGVSANLRVQYEMSHKRIVARLAQPLVAGFEYRMELDAEKIIAVSGAPMLARARVSFTTGTTSHHEGSVLPSPTWADVEPIFAEGCGCHRLEPMPERWFAIPPLTFDGLVGAPSIQRPGVSLVEPYRPHESYLMHKILDDYPDRDGTAMPPLWADEVELEHPLAYRALSRDEIARIEDWIQLGAKP